MPSLFCWKQICHSKTAIKLTARSLSHPPIKGRYPVYGPMLGSGVSSKNRHASFWHGGVVTWGGAAEALWWVVALPVVYLQLEDVSQVSITPLLKMSCCLRAGEAFFLNQVFRGRVGAVTGSGPHLVYRKVINYSWKRAHHLVGWSTPSCSCLDISLRTRKSFSCIYF